MPGNWNVKCLKGQGKRLVAYAETFDPLVTGRVFGEWVELMLGTADVRWSRFYPAFLLFLFC
jgi:exocyst complex protein 7